MGSSAVKQSILPCAMIIFLDFFNRSRCHICSFRATTARIYLIAPKCLPVAPHELPGDSPLGIRASRTPGLPGNQKIKNKRATPRANPWNPLNLLVEVEVYLSYIALCSEEVLVDFSVEADLLLRVGVTIVTPIAQALFGEYIERIMVRTIVVIVLCV